MRGIIFTILGALLCMNGVCHAAEAVTAAQPVKIGVVDMQVIAAESEPAKAAKAQMDSKYGKDKEALEKRGNALKKQAESLKNPKVSEDKKVAFIKAKQKLDQDTRNFMRKVEQDEVKIRQDIVTLIFSAAYEVSKAQGYTFVVDITAAGVLYANPATDITKAVLAEVNKIYQANKDKKPEEQKADDKKPADKK